MLLTCLAFLHRIFCTFDRIDSSTCTCTILWHDERDKA